MITPVALTARQQEIVGTIRRLFAEGKPLNLTAMTRENPDLIRQVFDLRPFWGWRRAIEDSGLSYERIPIELEETVECLACGKHLRLLSGHLSANHGLTRGEYQAEFPGAWSASEAVRASRMRRAQPVAHWEPVWSAEYVLDRIRFLHDQGFPVNAKGVDRTLAAAGRKFWGSWDPSPDGGGPQPNGASPCSSRTTVAV